MRTLKDPAPSRAAYRLNRLLLTPSFMRFLRFGLPVLALATAALVWWSDEGRREEVALRLQELKRSVEARPEFRVAMMRVEGVDAALEREVRDVLALDFPMSSFDLDLQEVRARVETLPMVRQATAKLRAGGVLTVNVEPREAVAVWRGAGGLWLIDETGRAFRQVSRRQERADLPLVAGDGAETAVAEALILSRALEGLTLRLRGLRRVGARRWDVMLDRGQRILLPETDALAALQRALALDTAQDLFARDVTAVDLRNPGRPVLRLGPTARAERATHR